MLKWRYSSTLS